MNVNDESGYTYMRLMGLELGCDLRIYMMIVEWTHLALSFSLFEHSWELFMFGIFSFQTCLFIISGNCWVLLSLIMFVCESTERGREYGNLDAVSPP